MIKNLLIIIFLIGTSCLLAMDLPKFSTAGFYELPNTGRKVYSTNLAWRFIKGDVEGTPYVVDFDDSSWEVVSIPHGLEYLPVEASGCVNYQGVVWYRKRFIPESCLKGKQLFIHFEAIMGKSEVYVNGKLLKKQYGGYLPVILDVTEELEWGKENVIAVKADNSDDPLYPVGKAQNMLDFTYFGGIYRDCWLVAHNDVFITNANYENEVAGGGLFVSFADVSEKSAVVNLKAHIRNNSMKGERVTVSFELKDKQGKVVKQTKKKISVKKGTASYALSSMLIESPCLWIPPNGLVANGRGGIPRHGRGAGTKRAALRGLHQRPRHGDPEQRPHGRHRPAAAVRRAGAAVQFDEGLHRACAGRGGRRGRGSLRSTSRGRCPSSGPGTRGR